MSSDKAKMTALLSQQEAILESLKKEAQALNDDSLLAENESLKAQLA